MPEKKKNTLSTGIIWEKEESGDILITKNSLLDETLLRNSYLEERLTASNTFINVCREVLKGLQDEKFEESIVILSSALSGYDEGEKSL